MNSISQDYAMPHVRSPTIPSQLMPDKSFVIAIDTRAIFAKPHLIIHVRMAVDAFHWYGLIVWSYQGAS
jgi:hypothetical protein